MKIPLTEPTCSRYVYINPKTNQVHLLMPIVSGTEIGLDNTCKSGFALQEFFGKTQNVNQRAVRDELIAYQNALEFDIGLLDDKDIKAKKEERLLQIQQYIEAIDVLLKSDGLNSLNLVSPEYPSDLQAIMKKDNANLHSMVLCPKIKDNWLRFVNPVFSVNRDGRGELYQTLSEAYKGVTTLPNTKTRFINSMLEIYAKEEQKNFEALQRMLTKQTLNQFKVTVDFYHTSDKTEVTQALMDEFIGSDEDNLSTANAYIDMLLEVCARELFNNLPDSPFYTRKDAEELSIITQFFLANVTIYCYANQKSTVNFGKILDDSQALSEEAAGIVLSITQGDSIEDALLDFVNRHVQDFGLLRTLTTSDKAQIKRKFTECYNIIKEAPHFDEFILLDDNKKGPFVSHQGSICLDFAEFMQAAMPTQAPEYFKNTLDDFNQLDKDAITSTNPSVHATLELSVEQLLAKIKNEDQLNAVLAKLTEDQKMEILASPQVKRMQVPKFLLHVARGEQDEAEKLLEQNPDAEFLLQSGEFTDYSGRTFNCTAFEYAYWAKDTHMCRMLTKHMDEDTKAKMLQRCEAIEAVGLTYTQRGIEVKNSKHFEFKPLIDALKDYVDGFEKRNWNERDAAWLRVGIAQRDLPAHVAHEYCRPDRSFDPRPEFNEPSLHRVLTFHNFNTNRDERWFPLAAAENSGLGFDFALLRRGCAGGAQRRGGVVCGGGGRVDLAAASHLDEVRSDDLKQLRKDLTVAEPEQNLGRSCQ